MKKFYTFLLSLFICSCNFSSSNNFSYIEKENINLGDSVDSIKINNTIVSNNTTINLDNFSWNKIFLNYSFKAAYTDINSDLNILCYSLFKETYRKNKIETLLYFDIKYSINNKEYIQHCAFDSLYKPIYIQQSNYIINTKISSNSYSYATCANDVVLTIIKENNIKDINTSLDKEEMLYTKMKSFALEPLDFNPLYTYLSYVFKSSQFVETYTNFLVLSYKEENISTSTYYDYKKNKVSYFFFERFDLQGNIIISAKYTFTSNKEIKNNVAKLKDKLTNY